MEQKLILRNLKLYAWFQALREPLFWGPVLITYIQQIGRMSLSQIYVMESIVVVAVMLLQIPGGAIADRIGRKRTMVIGMSILVLDSVLFGIGDSPAWMWAANLAWAFGYSLVSGADSALLYDTLVAAGRTDDFKRIEGRTIAYRLLLMALTSLSVGYLAGVHMRLPVLLGIPGILAAVAVVANMVEPPRTKSTAKHWDLMKLSVLFVANNRKVKWIIAYAVLLTVIGKVWFFTYNPYFELVHLPLAMYGWVFFGLNLVAAIFSWGAAWLAKHVPASTSIASMVVLTGVPIVLMALIIAAPMVVLVLMQNVVRGYLKPFMGHFLHDHLDSDNRATVASVQSAVDGFGQVVLLGIFGLVLQVVSLPASLLLLGVFTLVAGGALLVAYPRVFGRSTSVR
ncbi:MAG: MFS transporter [Patescibacteria group bacterium]